MQIYGRSGSGKTTLLHVVAGLLEHTSGQIGIGPAQQEIRALTSGQRLARAGMVFQFPERHFLGSTILEELSAGFPRCVLAASGGGGSGGRPRGASSCNNSCSALAAAGSSSLQTTPSQPRR